MARRLKDGEQYAGRHSDATVVNITMDIAAATLLRQAERVRLREEIAQVLGGE